MRRDLNSLFEPQSVAVLGASDTAGKWGNVLAQTVVKGEHRRRVYFVNRRGGTVLGRPAYTSLEEVPEAPELVVIVVPADGFEAAVEAAISAGVQAIIAIVAGLGELRESYIERERAVVERVREAGAVLLGPNCMGVIDTASELSAAAHLTLPPGEIAFVTQSGGLGLDLGLRAARNGVGFSRFASLGNQADLKAADLLLDLADHEPTRVVAVYLEDIADGPALGRAALRVRESGRYVVLLAPGRTEAVARAASSHTASLVGDDKAIAAICAGAGMIRVSTPGELFDTCLAFARPRLPAGRSLSIVSDGGGAAVVGAELAEGAGFTVPDFGPATRESLAAVVPELTTVRNPLDLLADNPHGMARAVEIVVESKEVDAVLVTGALGYNASRQYPPELGDLSELERAEVEAATKIGRLAEGSGIPIVASTIATPSPVIDELARFGVPMYREIDAAVRALRSLLDASLGSLTGVPDTTATSEPAIESADYSTARALLVDAGIEFAECRFVTTLDAALEAARKIGFPVVLKALDLAHKSDAGGVALGLEAPDDVAPAYRDIERRLSPSWLSVERMAPLDEGVELIVGARRDPRLGPILLVGLGGIFAEVIADFVTLMAPAEANAIRDALDKLSGAELLRGARGRSPVDVKAVADAARKLSRVAASHPEIAEIEINPLLATASGAIALDAHVTLVAAESGERRLEQVS